MARDAEFTEFVAIAYPSLVRTARLLSGDHQIAEDLVQTALIRVYLHWNAASARDSPQAYARRVLVNLFASWRRRRWRGEVPGHVPDLPSDGGDIEMLTDRHTLRAALARLPPAQRLVVVLRFYEDLSVQETAALLGCSAGTVKSRTNRALARLRESGALVGFAERGRS